MFWKGPKAKTAKKGKSSKKCHKCLADVMIVNDHQEQEGNEISQEENDTSCSFCGNYGKHAKKGGLYATYVMIRYAPNVCQQTQI